jgi:hypothetical protein
MGRCNVTSETDLTAKVDVDAAMIDEFMGTDPAYWDRFPFNMLARVLRNCPDDMLDRVTSEIPVLSNPYTRVLEVTANLSTNFGMQMWHCGTTHCLGGTIVDLAGLTGSDMENRLGTAALATAILRRSRPDAPLRNFHSTNKQAAAFIRARAKEEQQ